MKTIEVKITIPNIDHWNVDWDNENEKAFELLSLKNDMLDAISDICVTEPDSIIIELDLKEL